MGIWESSAQRLINYALWLGLISCFLEDKRNEKLAELWIMQLY